MPLINDAAKLYMGSSTVTAAYMAGVKVWPKPVANTLAASLTYLGGVTAQVSTAFSGTTPSTYKYYSSTNGGGWVLRHTGGAGPLNFDTTYSSTFVMKVESYDADGNGLQTATTNTITTGAAPPVYVQRTVYLDAVDAKSYRGNNAQRTDSSGLANSYYGMTTLSGGSTWGEQKSLARFNIPAEIRNCVSVDEVQIRWYNNHHHLNSGGLVSMVAHHNSTLGTTFGGSTGVLLNAGSPVRWPAPKPGWINGGTPPNEWYHLGWLTSAGRYSIAEEIRVHGLQGFGLIRPDGVSGNNGYGYAARNPQLFIKYTVRL